MTLPLISVIIPTYNRSKLLKRALTSVVNQSFKNFEVVVVDNYSTDDTFDVVRSFSDHRIRYFLFRNFGIISRSRNYGAMVSVGRYLSFLDSDDCWYSNKLHLSVKSLSSSVDITYHHLDIFREDLEKLSGKFLKTPSSFKYSSFLTHGVTIPTSSVTVSKALFSKLGGFDESAALVTIEDCELWFRLALNGAIFKRINQSLGFYSINDSNASVSSPLQDRVLKYFYNLSLSALSPRDRQLSSSFLLYRLSRLHLARNNYKSSLVLMLHFLRSSYPFGVYKLKAIYIVAFILLSL